MTKEQTPELQSQRQNANAHTERGASMLELSIQKDGWIGAMTATADGEVFDGSLRLDIGMPLLAVDPIVVRSNGDRPIVHIREDIASTDDPRAKRLSVAANRIAEVSLNWDAGVLEDWDNEVGLDDFWLEGEERPWDSGADESSDEEDTSELLDRASNGGVTSRVSEGDIWQLGRHYMACGDSTDEENIRHLLGDRIGDVGMVWADPPYGIKIQDKSGRVGGAKPGGLTGGGAKAYPMIIGDNSTDIAVTSMNQAIALFPKSVLIYWGANHYGAPPSSCWIVWDKKTERGDFEGIDFADGELAWTNQKTAVRIFRHLWLGAWRQSESGESRVHPTQKPVALCEWVFEKYGQPNDVILDPFLGSAPSIIAAEKMGGDRTVYGFEASPEYCEVIIQRWEKMSGEAGQRIGELPA